MIKFFLNTTNILLLIAIVLILLVLYQARIYHTREPEPPEPPVVEGACDETHITAGTANCPRLEWNPSTVQYVGGFRTPTATSNGYDWSYAQYGGMDFDPESSTLYISEGNSVCAITIPEPVNNADPNFLPMATWAQGCVDPGEGKIAADMGTADYKLGTPILFGPYVYDTAYWYFDSGGQQTQTHFRHARTLATKGGYQGLDQVSTAPEAGWTSTIMGHVPPEWQKALGGPVVTGGGGIPIITRQPYGHSLFTFDPAKINAGPEPVPAIEILGHPDNHALGVWGAQSEIWNGSSVYHGVVFVNGTRTGWIAGWHGYGPWCYGNGGTANPPPPGENCYDPVIPAHGTHAYPYRLQLWAYDLGELKRVHDKAIEPWEPKPYAIIVPEVPTPSCCPIISGLAYNPAKQWLFLMQAKVHGFDHSQPAIHVFHITIPGAAPATRTGRPVWIALIILFVIVAIAWWLARRPADAAPGPGY